MHFKTILVPIDFSHFSKKALEVALSFSRCCRGKIHLIHVEEDIFHMKRIHTMHPPLESLCDQVHEDYLKEKRKQFEMIKKEVPKPLLATAVIKEGHPFVEIVKYAKTKCIDLIVMSSRGESDIKHALLGSTTEKVARKAECAVLIVKDKRCRSVKL